MDLKHFGQSSALVTPKTINLDIKPEDMEWFKTLVRRGMNTWADAPQAASVLYDMLFNGGVEITSQADRKTNMANELQTVGAMHQCKAGDPYSTCVHCGALAEALNKPCPHFMRDATKIVIPTHTMEQEFQKHYQRGYEAGQKATSKSANITDPIGEVESSLRFAGGFHARLYNGATMPEPGTKLYTNPPDASQLNSSTK